VIGVSRESRTWRNPSTGLYTGPYFWDPAKADPNKVSGLTGSQVNPSAFPSVVGGRMWQNRNRPMSSSLGLLRGTSAYVDFQGIDVVYVTDESGNLRRYTVRDLDPAHDTWQLVGQRPISGATGWGSAAIDPTNNMYLMTLTRTSFAYWDLDRPGLASSNRALQVFPIVEAGTTPPDFRNFGVQFDPVLSAFLLWNGSDSIWRLTPPDDLDANNDGILDVAKGWTLDEIDVLGIGPHIPERYTGVYGKWVYMDKYNAFLGVIDPYAGDVFLYKPSYEQFAGIARLAVTVPEASTTAMLLAGLLGIFASSRRVVGRATDRTVHPSRGGLG